MRKAGRIATRLLGSPCSSPVNVRTCRLLVCRLKIPTQAKCVCSMSSFERDRVSWTVRWCSGEVLNKDSLKENDRRAYSPTLADASSVVTAALLCIGYNTVWSELCECNEQTHSRQCCNLLISWRVNAGVWYIVAAGLAGSASADQSSVDPRCSIVTSAVGTWLLFQLFAWNGCGKFCFVFYISEEDEIEDCSYQRNRFLHLLRG